MVIEMYKLKIKLGAFKDFVMIVDSFVDELKLTITEKEIHYTVIDPAHVIMGSCELRAGAFESYEVDEEFIFGVDISELKSVFKLGKSGDMLYISGDAESFNIHINNSRNKIPLLGVASLSSPKIPTMQLANKIEINKELFKQILGRCSDVSDFVAININENGFRIIAQGDGRVADSKIYKTSLVYYEFSTESLSFYSLSYLYGLVRNLKFKSLTLYNSNDDPIKIEFDKPYMSGMVLLAPRVESDGSSVSIPEDDPADYSDSNNMNNDDLW